MVCVNPDNNDILSKYINIMSVESKKGIIYRGVFEYGKETMKRHGCISC